MQAGKQSMAGLRALSGGIPFGSHQHTPLHTQDSAADLDVEIVDFTRREQEDFEGIARERAVSFQVNVAEEDEQPSFKAEFSALVRKFKKKKPKFFYCLVATLSGLIVLLWVLAFRRHGRRSHLDNAGDVEPTSSATDDVWARFQATSPGLGVVATDSATCSEIGISVLEKGGNAFDAGVASALCLGVVSPASSGLGGGAFIVTYNATTGTAGFIDSRETAPADSEPDMFDINPQLSQDNGLAVATLAELKGLYEMHQRLGVLPWKECTNAAAELAEAYTVSAELADILASTEVTPYLLSGDYKALSNLFLDENGQVKKEGDLVRNTNLAHTIREIGLYGSDYIYITMAEILANEVRQAGGILLKSDIENYETNTTNPVTADVFGHTLYSAAGSSSGGVAVVGIAHFMHYEQPLASEGLVYNHRLVEGLKNVFAIRMSLADPAFIDTNGPVSALKSRAYMDELRSNTSDSKVKQNIDDYGGEYNLAKAARRYLPEDHGTSHFSIVDKFGNALAMTSTVNTYFGSKVVSPSTGIVFNNQMDDFSNANAPNYFGLAPSLVNLPAAGKRPLSSMSPSIVVGESGVRLVGGASGGPRIITATAQVLLNYLGRGYNLLESVIAPRLHSQLLPNTTYVEEHNLISGLSIKNPSEVASFLQDRGGDITEWDGSFGVSQYVAVDPDSNLMTAVSDPRKNGEPRGVQP